MATKKILALSIAMVIVLSMLTFPKAIGENNIINVDYAISDFDNDKDEHDISFKAHVKGSGKQGIHISVYDQFLNLVGEGYTDENGGLLLYDFENGDYTWIAKYLDEEIERGMFNVNTNINTANALTDGDNDEEYDDFYIYVADENFNSINFHYIITDDDGTYAEGNASGFYLINNLPIGYYNFTAENSSTSVVYHKGMFYSYGTTPITGIINVENAVGDGNNDNQLNDAGFFAHIEDNGVQGIHITTYDEDGNYVKDGYTDSNGTLYFYNLSNGNYTWIGENETDIIDYGTFNVDNVIQHIDWLYDRDRDSEFDDFWFSVRDANDNGISGIKVIITNNTGTYSEGYTDSNGEFFEYNLPRGYYNYTAQNLTSGVYLQNGTFYSYGTLPPSENGTANIYIYNSANYGQNVNLVITNNTGEVYNDTVFIGSNKDYNTSVELQTGNYTFKAIGEDGTEDSKYLEVIEDSSIFVSLTVGEIIKLSSNDSANIIFPGDSTQYYIKVLNDGNKTQNISLSIQNVPQNWSANLNIYNLTLDADEYEYITLTVNSPSSAVHGDSANIFIYGKNETEENDTIETKTIVKEKEGGPDNYGYLWKDTNYNFIDISENGTNTEIKGNDGYSNITLPYKFIFYGNNYTNIYIGTNGLIGFNENEMSSSSNQYLPESFTPNNLIAVFWDDLDVRGDLGSAIYYQHFTGSNYTIIQWNNVYFLGNYEDSITFQVIIYDNGNIIMQYKDVYGNNEWNDFGSSATVGIENETGGIGLQYSYSKALIENTTALLFYYPDNDVGVKNGSIEGYVKEGNKPIENANVSIPSLLKYALTDSNGYYKIIDIPEGTYSIKAEHSDYQTQTKTNINVPPGTTVRVDFNLALKTTLTGTVKDKVGNLIKDVNITILGTSLTAITDEHGNYTITNVPIGEKIVKANKTNYKDEEKTINIIEGKNILDFEIEYLLPKLSVEDILFSQITPYESANVEINVKIKNNGGNGTNISIKLKIDGDLIEEKIIDIDCYSSKEIKFNWTAKKGQHEVSVEIDGIEMKKEIITVNELPKGSLRGVVKDILGNPISNASIEVLNTNFIATTDSNGNYSINNIPTGTYKIRASKSNYKTEEKSYTIQIEENILDFILKYSQPKIIVESIFVEPTKPKQGEKAIIKITLKNIGETGTIKLKVKIDNIDLGDVQFIQIAKEETKTIEIDWIPNNVGIFTISVEINDITNEKTERVNVEPKPSETKPWFISGFEVSLLILALFLFIIRKLNIKK